MRDVSEANFGIVIAYLLPGLTILLSLSQHAEPVRVWLAANSETGPTIGGFLFATLASIGAGLTASTVRWLVIDSLHHATGIPQPRWNFARLPEGLAAYDRMIDNHYRYYQFYGNSVVAIIFGYGLFRLTSPVPEIWLVSDVGVIGLLIVFYLGSRDSLWKYYQRSSAVLGAERTRRVVQDRL